MNDVTTVKCFVLRFKTNLHVLPKKTKDKTLFKMTINLVDIVSQSEHYKVKTIVAHKVWGFLELLWSQVFISVGLFHCTSQK